MSDYSYFCGIDLAKNHFSLHAVDQNGKVILHKSVTRSKLLTTIANMPLIRIGVERVVVHIRPNVFSLH
ncbi:hypothetical protein VCHA48P434_40096 [Vibrio chagasii]|nr:hypothetical protein VCHA48P434_40096 [Vibrio chagasii]